MHTPPTKPKRSMMACLQCRERKVKCDHNNDGLACERCRRTKKECRFEPVTSVTDPQLSPSLQLEPPMTDKPIMTVYQDLSPSISPPAPAVPQWDPRNTFAVDAQGRQSHLPYDSLHTPSSSYQPPEAYNQFSEGPWQYVRPPPTQSQFVYGYQGENPYPSTGYWTGPKASNVSDDNSRDRPEDIAGSLDSFPLTDSTKILRPTYPMSGIILPLGSTSVTMSDMEATYYYAGLPSSPRLLARTSTNPWEKPKGPEAYNMLKQLGIVANHKLNIIWEDNVAPRVHSCLDEMAVQWTSTDVVRLGIVGEFPAPVILWIGVTPKTLDGENANTAAFRCLDVLKEFDITDVQVEIRESSVTRFAGLKLLPPVLSTNPTAAVRHPLTHALGLSISAQAMPFRAGSGGFFMTENSDSDKLLLITARHVLFPPEKNDKFQRKNDSQPRYNVLLLGDEAYKRCLASIQARIGDHTTMIQHWRSRIETVDNDDEDADAERHAAQGEIQVAENAIEALCTFHKNVDKNWATYVDRVLGHVVFSPPIRLGAGIATEKYTEDYAIIEVDDNKIDRTKFKGNVIDLGTKIPVTEFMEKMYANPKNATSFKYPPNRLLTLRGTISEKEMRKPTLLDQNNDPCLMVIKDGSTTGVTIGRASGIMSYVREYFDDHHETSKEWAIHSYDHKSAFSEKGDSGAVIVDGLGRIGGLLTGGCGSTVSSDITYATPINFLLKSIRANGYPNAHLNPMSSPQVYGIG